MLEVVSVHPILVLLIGRSSNERQYQIAAKHARKRNTFRHSEQSGQVSWLSILNFIPWSWVVEKKEEYLPRFQSYPTWMLLYLLDHILEEVSSLRFLTLGFANSCLILV